MGFNSGFKGLKEVGTWNRSPANWCSGYLRDRKVGEVAAPARLLSLYLLPRIRKQFLLRFERQHFELKIYRTAIHVRARNNTLSKSELRQQNAPSLKQLVCIKCTNVVSHTVIPFDFQCRFDDICFYSKLCRLPPITNTYNDREVRWCHLLVLFTTTTNVDCYEHP
jgi:hypothetical protein